MLYVNLLSFFIKFSSKIMVSLKDYWGILKMKVYDNNWSAKTRPQMMRGIKSKVKEIDQKMAARMFDNLKAKIHSANENGLFSLL